MFKKGKKKDNIKPDQDLLGLQDGNGEQADDENFHLSDKV